MRRCDTTWTLSKRWYAYKIGKRVVFLSIRWIWLIRILFIRKFFLICVFVMLFSSCRRWPFLFVPKIDCACLRFQWMYRCIQGAHAFFEHLYLGIFEFLNQKMTTTSFNGKKLPWHHGLNFSANVWCATQFLTRFAFIEKHTMLAACHCHRIRLWISVK